MLILRKQSTFHSERRVSSLFQYVTPAGRDFATCRDSFARELSKVGPNVCITLRSDLLFPGGGGSTFGENPFRQKGSTWPGS